MVVWMADAPLEPGASDLVKHTTNLVQAAVRELRYRVNVNTLRREQADRLALNEIGRVRLQLARPVAYDPYARNRATGNFVLIDRRTNVTVGAGMIIDRAPGESAPSGESGRLAKATNVQRHGSLVTAAERVRLLGQRPATVWLTGLPRSGKSTIAFALEKRLIELGHAAVVLDGDNMRLGVSSDLGFSADDRSENVRRAAGVARILNEAGLVAIAAFVSPYAADRDRARQIVGRDAFVEVYLSAPIEACEARDDRELYRKARSGEIKTFSGVSAPYEPPLAPELTLPTHEIDVATSVERVLDALKKRNVF
jgi:bifunctional enzyme CysN/CysC